ncbi:YezD family protein [Thermomonas carbonis]|uniref:YezD family protein n=1 Tax=Thermomonas carbonis TaxID=1463158 RepID=A0A7G9SR41_9GAMM|nr:YezD family protein [Thermomonas carbonis]QNN70316.1 YezD family protein [Thermomonas carbonis]GHB99182.1 hypothetical protein GCM10010080_09880 [Thermomonas carbonis]
MSANPASSLQGQPASVPAAIPEVEAEVLRAIRDTHFGTVEIVVHQSRVVQITRSEKVRFDAR